MDDEKRRPAFPERTLSSFVGKFPEMVALASAAGIRNSMEDHHAGVVAEPDARVIWPGGSCRYADAAKISDERLQAFTHAVSHKIAQDLHRSYTRPDTWGREALQNFEFSFACAEKWFLPIQQDVVTDQLSMAMRAELSEGALRKEARSVKVLGAAIAQYPRYAEPLVPATAGDQGAARAFDHGQDVSVAMLDGSREPWAEVSHMSDDEMMAFNIGMADYVVSAYEAMERVAFERPARRRAHWSR